MTKTRLAPIHLGLLLMRSKTVAYVSRKPSMTLQDVLWIDIGVSNEKRRTASLEAKQCHP
jgi:hypothetical protein